MVDPLLKELLFLASLSDGYISGLFILRSRIRNPVESNSDRQPNRKVYLETFFLISVKKQVI